MEITGGEKLEQVLDEIAESLQGAGSVKIGFLSRATYPDGKQVAMIAAIQNFGAPGAGIPPRPFFSNMIATKSAGWPSAIALNLKETDYDAAKTLANVGEGIAGQLRQSIKDTNSPPLAASTLRKRGYVGKPYNAKDPATFGAKPLVATGNMLGSVDYEVQ